MSPEFLKQRLQTRQNFLHSLISICCLGLHPVPEATSASIPGPSPGWISDVLLHCGFFSEKKGWEKPLSHRQVYYVFLIPKATFV